MLTIKKKKKEEKNRKRKTYRELIWNQESGDVWRKLCWLSMSKEHVFIWKFRPPPPPRGVSPSLPKVNVEKKEEIEWNCSMYVGVQMNQNWVTNQSFTFVRMPICFTRAYVVVLSLSLPLLSFINRHFVISTEWTDITKTEPIDVIYLIYIHFMQPVNALNQPKSIISLDDLKSLTTFHSCGRPLVTLHALLSGEN